MQVELVVVEGKQQGAVIPVRNKFLIGREEDCQLRPNSELVSRHHCVFTIDDYTVRLRDLGSTNGTYVNEERTNGLVVLKSGDRIRIGKLVFELRIQISAPAPQPAAQPAAPPRPAPQPMATQQMPVPVAMQPQQQMPMPMQGYPMAPPPGYGMP
ncbi:MAG TPA: FHA domain-containing protein, partial [Planctomycetaceae bacterium]|nr:FHA domain-containing protein [Planctomycetaceae bacterium]